MDGSKRRDQTGQTSFQVNYHMAVCNPFCFDVHTSFFTHLIVVIIFDICKHVSVCVCVYVLIGTQSTTSLHRTSTLQAKFYNLCLSSAQFHEQTHTYVYSKYYGTNTQAQYFKDIDILASYYQQPKFGKQISVVQNRIMLYAHFLSVSHTHTHAQTNFIFF